jgi:Kip1 ubiquitination-promoting complex protein 1
LANNQATTLFLNSLLNQLNWAFSEFIGMVQEIHNISARPERGLIESRQLRICATCFDLAVSLLRVLEMIASVAAKVFTDFSLASTESLLARLCQVDYIYRVKKKNKFNLSTYVVLFSFYFSCFVKY